MNLDEDKPVSRENALIILPIAIGLLLTKLLRVVLLWQYYIWFLVPLGLPSISVLQTLGATLTIRLLIYQYRFIKKGHEKDYTYANLLLNWRNASEFLIMQWLVGYALHELMLRGIV